MDKVCSKCGKTKPFSEFYRQANGKHGLKARCKKCAIKDTALNRKQNRNHYREYNRRPDQKEKHKDRAQRPEVKAANNRAVRKWMAKNPEKAKAHHAVGHAIKAGRLIRPDYCPRCKKLCKPEAHHNDYSKPLDIEWLCQLCHTEEHIYAIDHET